MPEKCCWTCKETKPYAAFPPSDNPRYSRSTSCEDCMRHRKHQQTRTRLSRAQLRKHNLAPEAYLAMRAAQEDCCAICGTHESALTHLVGTWKRLVVDHDHATGQVRGLLCHSCNRALGSFHDSISTLRNAIRYLQGMRRRGEASPRQLPLFASPPLGA